MPIAFPCSGCARTLVVPDSLAGRRGKCPKCGAANVIPADGQAQSEAPRPRPAQRPVSAHDVIEEKAVRRRPPPEPLEPEEVADEPAAEEAEGDRPRKGRKKKGKSPTLLIGLAGGGCGLLLLMCSGAGALVWWFFLRGGPGDELKYMPSNCQFVASIRMNELKQSDAFQQMRREIPEVEKAMSKDLPEEMGLSSDNMEQMVFGGNPSNQKETVTVVRLKKAVTPEQVRSQLKGGTYTETKVGKYTLSESQGGSPSFCMVNSKMIVLGEKEVVRAVLTRDKKPEFSKNLQEAMKKADFSKTIAYAVDLKAGPSQPGPGLAGPNMFGGMDKATALGGYVKVASDVSFELTLLCPDPKSAEDAKKVIDGLLAMVRGNQGVQKEFAEMLDINLKVSGNNVIASKSFKVGPLIQAYKNQKIKPF